MTTFALSDIEAYRREYSRLGAALGVTGAVPAPGEIEFLRHVATPGLFPFGMLTPSDIFFAGSVASILRPAFMIEIGTASGFTAAILAKMIALRQAECGVTGTEPLVHTIDKKADFVFDRTLPVGFAIDLMTPDLRDQIALHPLQDSSFCPSLTTNEELRFAFVDGNHRHPWPLTDVLRLQRLMASGWILLHDIDLPAAVAHAHAKGQALDLGPAAGAKHVFDFWPDEKIRAGNIGAVRIPRDRSSLGELVVKLKGLPGEVSVGSWTKQWREIEKLRTELTRRR